MKPRELGGLTVPGRYKARVTDEFAGYRFHRVLRDGSFEATEVETGDPVVIESPAGVSDPDLREWFGEAWAALAELEHPSLPDVRSVGEQDGTPFAVLRPVDGVEVPELPDDDEGLDATTLRIMICRLADGLELAHQAGVIHGDLGPADVIVERAGQGERVACVTGFGRVEGLRPDDVRGLGEVIESLLRTARPPAETEDDERDGAVDDAILAMLSRVAREAREGSLSGAAEVRDAVAAGSEEQRSTRLDLMVGIVAAVVVVIVVAVLLLL